MTNLLQQLIIGESSAFEEVYNTYHAKIYFFTLKYVKDQHFALDITQQAFIQLWEKRESLHANKPLDAQFFVLARNLTIDNLRKQARDKALEVNFGLTQRDVTESTEQAVILADYQQAAQKIIGTMPPKRQQIYRLNKEQGLSIDEIAQQMSISPKTVDAQLQLALKYLRSKIPHFLHTLFF